MNKRVDIQFGGLTTVPSDYSCQDGDLAVCHNLVNEGGELKPIFPLKPSFAIPIGYVVKYVHRTTDASYYIFYKSSNKSWYFSEEGAYTGDTTATGGLGIYSATDDFEEFTTDDTSAFIGEMDTINSIGNILIFTDSTGEDSFFRYISGGYKFLGHHLPRLPKILFSLKTLCEGTVGMKAGKGSASYNSDPPYADLDKWPEDLRDGVETDRSEIVTCTFEYKGGYNSDGTVWQALSPKLSDQDSCIAYFNAGMATIAAAHERHSLVGAFDQPFIIRYAFRLYDGSHSRMSPPVLLTPTSKCFLPWVHGGEISGTTANFGLYDVNAMSLLYYSVVEETITDDSWKDIIDGVDIFISSPIYTYDMAATYNTWQNGGDAYVYSADFGKTYGYSDLRSVDGEGDYDYNNFSAINIGLEIYQGDDTPNWSTYFRPPYKSDEQLKKDIDSVGVFYKVGELTTSEIKQSTVFKRFKIERNVLNSLEGRETLAEDYLSNYDICGKKFVYNHRLLAFDCTRDYTSDYGWSMLQQFSYDTNSYPAPKIYVKLVKSGITYVTSIEQTLSNLLQQTSTFFYPDPDATSLTLDYTVDGPDGTTIELVKEFELKRHPMLNCSYYYGGIEKTDIESSYGSVPTGPSPSNVPMMSRVYMSAVDNPFTFPSGLTCTVGTGTVKALAATTLPISEGQQGEFPVMAFTDEGIWALTITQTGSIYSTNPMLRDVLLSRYQLCVMDDSVAYATSRGIMVLQGKQSVCITDNIFESFYGMSGLPVLEKEGMPVSTFYEAAHIVKSNLPSGDVRSWIKNCRILYASTLNRLVVQTSSEAVEGYPALVYSLDTGKWSTMTWGAYGDAFNKYPDTFVHLKVYGTDIVGTLNIVTPKYISVSKISSEDTDSQKTSVVLTRPMQFGYRDMPKTIHEAIVRGNFKVTAITKEWDSKNLVWNRTIQNGDMTCVVYGSNNLKDWVIVNAVNSELIRGRMGTPFKYFRLLIVADKTLSKGEAITAATFDIQPRLNDTLR